MRFGLLQEGLCDPGTDGHRRYHEMVEEAVLAEECGDVLRAFFRDRRA